MATVFTRWIKRRRERKAREETYAAPSPPKDSVKVLQPSGETGTTITYTTSGGGGTRTPTTSTTTPTGTTYYPDVKLPEITPTPSRDIQTQQILRGEIYDPTREVYRRSVY